MIPGVNIGGKSSAASVNRAGSSGWGWGGGGGSGGSALRVSARISGYKENLDWLKGDLNTAKTITS